VYLTSVKALLVHAMRQTFDREYPVAEFRDLHVSIEFPTAPQHYPGVWVDFVPVGQLQIVGIGHTEQTSPTAAGTGRAYTRWRFGGEASFTLVALTSMERDRLLDEVVKTIAFGRENQTTSQFRDIIEGNDLIACNFDWDEIGVRGLSSSLGTPWQSDDMVYEIEVAMECFGEFISDHETATLLPFERVEITAYVEGEPDPTDPDGWITG
jgi:hypothetical protein